MPFLGEDPRTLRYACEIDLEVRYNIFAADKRQSSNSHGDHFLYLYQAISSHNQTAMQSLPPELLDQLCAFVAPAHLAVLARTSVACHSAAQRVLYRHVSLSSFARNLSCIYTLASNPRVASYVRSFAVNLNPFDGNFCASYDTLAQALTNMSELTSLEVFADQAASCVLANDTVYPRLQRFACSFHLDPHLVHFLNKSSSITELKIDSIPLSDSPMLPLPTTALPFLAHFTGSALAAQLIVPGRPVQYVDLNSGDLTDDVARNLALSTAPIRALGANTSSHSVSLIATLTSCMDRLQHLRIVTTFTFTDLPDTVSIPHPHQFLT